MHQRWKSVLTRLLISSLTIPASFLIGLANLQAVHAAANTIVLNEILDWPSSGNEMVELYNNTTAGSIDISGWTISDASGVIYTVPAATPSLNAGAFFTADLGGSSFLTNTGDTVTLKSGASTIDAVTYGSNLAATIVPPDQGKTLGRVADGGSWYSNLTASIGSTNGTPTVPSLPTSVSVPATGSNPVNTINATNKAAVGVSVATTDASVVTTQLVTALSSKESEPTAVTTSPTIASVNSTTVATGNPAIADADGPVIVRAFATANGIDSAYKTGTSASIDTIAPTPIVTSPASATTVHATSVTVTGTTETGSTVKLYASDGTTLVATATVTGTSYSVIAPLTANSANVLKVKATDAAGNETVTGATVPTITEDSTAPTAVTGLTFVSATTGKVTLSWANSVSADTASYSVFTDNATSTLSGTALASVSPGSGTTSFTTDVLANGTYKFAITAVDAVGNVSTNDIVTGVVVLGPKVQSGATAPGATADLTSSIGLTFSPSSASNGSSTFTVINNGTTVPTGSAPSGISFLGQFFEVTDSITPSVTSPVLIKFFYTNAQLTAAGISESQLQGIYFFDSASSAWKLFGNTGVNTTDITVNGTAYAGFVFANADHFTPLAFGADTTAPTKPANFLATMGDAQVSLTWNTVSDAVGYFVRYRQATSTDTTSYTTVFVSGGSVTNTTIKSLTNGTEYEFGVASQDAVGNVSSYAVVVATPIATASTTASSSTSTVMLTANGLTTTPLTSNTTVEQTNEPTSSVTTPTPEPANGQVGGGEATAANANQNRALVIALILVIAAGAGAAGYYGYQWWAERPVPTTTPAASTEPEPKTPGNGKKKAKTNGRW